MKTIKVNYLSEIPEKFTGVVEWNIGTKYWLKEGKQHREDGPAVEHPNGDNSWYKEGNRHREDGPAVEHPGGYKAWFLEGKRYPQIILKKYVILDQYQGPYNLMWYRLLDKDKIIECPDIPGLINKE